MARIFIVSGPSGVGKSTIVRAVMARHPELFLSESVTTRSPRAPGRDARVYRHMDEASFASAEANGEFLETARVHGYLYGTPREPVDRALGAGRDVLLEIDVQGAKKVKAAYPDAVGVFLEPPSWDVLVARLRSRGTEDPAALELRLRQARGEMDQAGLFDAVVRNDDLDSAVDEVDRILKAAKRKD